MALSDGQHARLSPLSRMVADRLEKHLRVSSPPPGYDPRDRPDSELASFALPPRPDRSTAPVAYRNWYRAMSPPLVFPPRPEVLADMFAVLPTSVRGARFANFRSIAESSRNWSGGYVRPKDRSPVALVQGKWHVPSTSAPSAGAEYAVSSWVGLDGNDPASISMPQVGVQAAHVENPSEEWLLAWWQWWVKPAPDALQIAILTLPITTGDEIYAQVQAVGPTEASFFIKNMAQGAAFSGIYSPPITNQTGPTPLRLDIEGRTAEWIVERPVVPGHDLWLPDFGTLLFTDCNAAVASGAGGILTDLPLDCSRLIALHEWDDPRVRGRLASKPGRETSTAFRLTYVA